MAPWKLARENDETSQRAAGRLRSTPPPKRCASPPRCSTPCCRNPRAKIWAQLGMTEPLESVRFDTLRWGGLPAGQKIGEVAGVFPRIEAKEAIEKMRELEEQATAAQAVLLGKTRRPPSAGGGLRQNPHRRFRQGGSARRPGAHRRARERLRQADAHEGRYRRAAAAHHRGRHRRGLHARPSWSNRKVVIVANLQPRKLKGIESNGMIVAASVNDGKPVLAGFHEDIPVGSAPEVKLVDSHCHLDDSEVRRRPRAGHRARPRRRRRDACWPSAPATARPIWKRPSAWPSAIHSSTPPSACIRTMPPKPRRKRSTRLRAAGGASQGAGHRRNRPRLPLRFLAARGAARGLRAATRDRRGSRQADRHPHPRSLGRHAGACLREHWRGGGIMHCFTGDAAQARQALDLGFHLSFGGVLTFPKAEAVREAARTDAGRPAAGGDRLPVSGARSASRQAQRAGLHGGDRAPPGRGARRHAGSRSPRSPRAISNGCVCRRGPANR